METGGGTVPRLGSSAPPAKAEPSPGPGSAQPRPRHLSQLISFNSAICQSGKSPWSWLIFFSPKYNYYYYSPDKRGPFCYNRLSLAFNNNH